MRKRATRQLFVRGMSILIGVGLLMVNKMPSTQKYTSLTARVLAEPIRKRVTVNKYVRGLFRKYRRQLFVKYRKDFLSFCRKNNVRNNKRTEKEYSVARFMHDLVRDQGVLGSIYILKKERRTDVLRRSEAGFIPFVAKGAKVPGQSTETMLRDMFSGKARYMVKENGNWRVLHVFGDCDELEKAYVRLLKMFSVRARIIMTMPNHVETVIKIDGKEFRIDNSFSKFGQQRTCKDKCSDYMVTSNGRTGTMGYGKMADAKAYLDKVNRDAKRGRTVVLTTEGQSRVNGLVKGYVGRLEIK